MSAITLAQARTIIEVAFEVAAKQNVANFIVVVTDPGGALKAMQRSDGAGFASVEIATAKVRTALGFRRSTASMTQYVENQSVNTTLASVLHGAFMPFGGGVAVVNEHSDLVGGAAFSGASGELDHAIITEAVQAAGLAVLD
jgi:uncharacterized protein GlcG (DUF336 family)